MPNSKEDQGSAENQGEHIAEGSKSEHHCQTAGFAPKNRQAQN